jgi:hypothetical protein
MQVGAQYDNIPSSYGLWHRVVMNPLRRYICLKQGASKLLRDFVTSQY